MRLILIAAIVALLAGCAVGGQWSRQDKVRQAVYTGLHLVDWGQTRAIAAHPDQFYEKYNPVLGRHPSRKKVDTWFAGTMIAHFLITDLLQPKYRPYWQYLTISIEGFMVLNNLSVGIAVQF